MKLQTLKTILFFAFFLVQFQVYSQCSIEVKLYIDDNPNNGMLEVGVEGPAVGSTPATADSLIQQVYLVEVPAGYDPSDPAATTISTSAIVTLSLLEGAYEISTPAVDCDKNYVVVAIEQPGVAFTLANSGTSDYTPILGDNDNDFINIKELLLFGIVSQGFGSVSGVITFAPPAAISPVTVETTYPVNSTDNEIYFSGLELDGTVTYSIDGGATTGANGSDWTLDPAGFITYNGGSIDGSAVDMITLIADNGTDTDTTFITINLIDEPVVITPAAVESTYPVNSAGNEIYFADLDLSGAITYSIDGGATTGANGSSWILDPAGFITYDGGSVDGTAVDMITLIADNGTDTDTTFITINLIDEPVVITPATVETTYPVNSTGNEIQFTGLDLTGTVTYTIDGGATTGANGSSWTLDAAGNITYDGGSVDGTAVDMITIIADNGTDTDTTFVTINLTNDPSTITPVTVEATYPVNSTGNEIQFAGLDLTGTITYMIDGVLVGANGSDWTLDAAGNITYNGGSVPGNGLDMITLVAGNGTDTDTTFVVINLIDEPVVITPTTVETTYPVNSAGNEIQFAGLDLTGTITYMVDGVLIGANGSDWTLDAAGNITYNGGSVPGNGLDMITLVADNGTDTDTTFITINLIEEPVVITPTALEVTYPVNSTGNEIQFTGLDLTGAITYSIEGGGLTGMNGSSWTLDAAGLITYDGGSVVGNAVDVITLIASDGTDTDTTFITINLIDELVGPTEVTVFGGGNETGLLPVELMSFSGTNAKNCAIDLEWATATESENEGFFIEKSEDGRNFDKIAWVEGAGNSSETIKYSFTDENSSRVNYYRLKQVDSDGTYEYSKTISINGECGSANNEITLFPSPAKNFVNVESTLGFVGTTTIIISDYSGKTHLSYIIDNGDVRSNEKIDISNLSVGLYFVRISDESNQVYTTQKFIKF